MRKVSWSVSMDDYDFTLNQLNIIKNYLANFERISVREEKTKSFLSSYTGKPISVTLDPTLLLSAMTWKRLCKSVKEHKYVLVYAVKDTDEVYASAKKIAKERGLRLVAVRAYCGASISRNVKQTSGPIEFLSYINSADYVVTSSFHGTVFSILFEKEFTCVIPEGHSNVRTESLLNSLGLDDRIGNQSSAPIQRVIDYESVNRKLEHLKEESLLFLSGALSEE
ncbi:MAG: polysaccharide pyruvyl transferase family protein [Bacteroidales bacterium]|nr:polysaccharide pyruvyl transferase family protein [Bacteroidales bacterium]